MPGPQVFERKIQQPCSPSRTGCAIPHHESSPAGGLCPPVSATPSGCKGAANAPNAGIKIEESGAKWARDGDAISLDVRRFLERLNRLDRQAEEIRGCVETMARVAYGHDAGIPSNHRFAPSPFRSMK